MPPIPLYTVADVGAGRVSSVVMMVGTRFGDLLKSYRDGRGWARSLLEEKSGVSFDSIRRYELGKQTPTQKMIIRLADALGSHTLKPLLEAAGYFVEPATEGAPAVDPDIEEIAELFKAFDPVARERMKRIMRETAELYRAAPPEEAE